MERRTSSGEFVRRGVIDLSQVIAKEAKTLTGKEPTTDSFSRVLAGICFYRSAYLTLLECGVKPTSRNVPEVVNYFLSTIQMPYSDTDDFKHYTRRDKADTALGVKITEAAQRTFEYAQGRHLLDRRIDAPRVAYRHDILGYRLRLGLNNALAIVSDEVRNTSEFHVKKESLEAMARVMKQVTGISGVELGTIETSFRQGACIAQIDDARRDTFQTADKRKLAYACVLEEVLQALGEDQTGFTSTILSQLSGGLIEPEDFRNHLNGFGSVGSSNRTYRRIGEKSGWRLNISPNDAELILQSTGGVNVRSFFYDRGRHGSSTPVAFFPFRVRVLETRSQPKVEKPVVTHKREQPPRPVETPEIPKLWPRTQVLPENPNTWEARHKRTIIKILAMPVGQVTPKRVDNLDAGILTRLGITPIIISEWASQYGASTPIGEIIEIGLFRGDKSLESLSQGAGVLIAQCRTGVIPNSIHEIRGEYERAMREIWNSIEPRNTRPRNENYQLRRAVTNTARSYVLLWNEQQPFPQTSTLWRLMQNEDWTDIRRVASNIRFALRGLKPMGNKADHSLGEVFFVRFIIEAEKQKARWIGTEKLRIMRDKVITELAQVIRQYPQNTFERRLLEQALKDLKEYSIRR